jgi:hypothetical protein
MTPLDFWTNAWRNTASLMQAAVKAQEMVNASAVVVAIRSRAIEEAVRNPLKADYGELSRMVPEKLQAFSQAGSDAFGDLFVWQTEAYGIWQQATGMMMAGKVPTLSQLERLSARSMRMARSAASAGDKALAPIHKTATANATRLQRQQAA